MLLKSLLNKLEHLLGDSPEAFIQKSLFAQAKRLNVLLLVAHITDLAKRETSLKLPLDILNDRNVIAHAPNIEAYVTPSYQSWQYCRSWLTDIQQFLSDDNNAYTPWESVSPVWMKQHSDVDRLAIMVRLFAEFQQYVDVLAKQDLTPEQIDIYQRAVIFTTFRIGQCHILDERNEFNRHERNRVLENFMQSLVSKNQSQLMNKLVKYRDNLIHCDVNDELSYQGNINDNYHKSKKIIENIMVEVPFISNALKALKAKNQLAEIEVKMKASIENSKLMTSSNNISAEDECPVNGKQIELIKKELIESFESFLSASKDTVQLAEDIREKYSTERKHILSNIPLEKYQKLIKEANRLFLSSRVAEFDTQESLAFSNRKFLDLIESIEWKWCDFFINFVSVAYITPDAVESYLNDVDVNVFLYQSDNIMHNPLLFAISMGLSQSVIAFLLEYGYSLDDYYQGVTPLIFGKTSLIAWVLYHPITVFSLGDKFDTTAVFSNAKIKSSPQVQENMQGVQPMPLAFESIIQIMKKQKITNLDGVLNAAVTMKAPKRFIQFLLDSGCSLNSKLKNPNGGSYKAWVALMISSCLYNPKYNTPNRDYFDIIMEDDEVILSDLFSPHAKYYNFKINILQYASSFQQEKISTNIYHKEDKQVEYFVFHSQFFEKLLAHFEWSKQEINRKNEKGNTPLAENCASMCMSEEKDIDKFACAQSLLRFKMLLAREDVDLEDYVFHPSLIVDKVKKSKKGKKYYLDEKGKDFLSLYQRIYEEVPGAIIFDETKTQVRVGIKLFFKCCVDNNYHHALAVANAAKKRGLESLISLHKIISSETARRYVRVENVKILLNELDNLIEKGKKIRQKSDVLKQCLAVAKEKAKQSGISAQQTQLNEQRILRFQENLEQAKLEYQNFERDELHKDIEPIVPHGCEIPYQTLQENAKQEKIRQQSQYIQSMSERKGVDYSVLESSYKEEIEFISDANTLAKYPGLIRQPEPELADDNDITPRLAP